MVKRRKQWFQALAARVTVDRKNVISSLKLLHYREGLTDVSSKAEGRSSTWSGLYTLASVILLLSSFSNSLIFISCLQSSFQKALEKPR